MIYLDEKGHLISDESLDELHLFAHNLGLKREWFQDHPYHPHYDLTTKRMREKAQKIGAQLVTSREIVLLLKTLYPIDKPLF
jgi:hypothetical protein